MPIRATVILADAAQAVGGKVNMLGGGWNIITASQSPSAVAVFLSMTWDLTNSRHHWRLELVNGDNEPVEVPRPDAPNETQPIFVEGEFEIGRPPGVPVGSDLVLPLAVQLGPLPLGPGRYVWRLLIDGEEPDESARAAFSAVASLPPSFGR